MYESTHTMSRIHVDQPVYPVENDDTLSRLIAVFLHNRLFAAPGKSAAKLQDLGWEDSLVSEMSTMPIDDVAKILSGSSACVGVVFDHRKAAAVVNSYRALKRDKSELDYFILNGATPALIRTLFPKVSARVVTEQRKLLGCDSRGGRPPLPDAENVYAIYRSWQTLCAEEPNLRARYRRLKEQYPAYSLATLCAALDAG